jgi:hypothetical protein
VVDPISKIHIMRYKACSLVESKDKILNPKLDGLHKHARNIYIYISSMNFGWLVLYL